MEGGQGAWAARLTVFGSKMNSNFLRRDIRW
jgi:hypothetical protein